MTRVLVTGVAGFCGPHLVRRLREDPDIEVWGIGRSAVVAAHVPLSGYRSCDVGDSEAVDACIRSIRPDRVYHLAGRLTGTSPQILQSNCLGAVNLLEALRSHAPAARALLVGSAAEYGAVPAERLPIDESQACAPAGPYAISKYAATMFATDYARRYGLHTIVARSFNIVGPGISEHLVLGAVLKRMRQALAGGHDCVPVGNIAAVRDFIAIDDAVDAYIRLMERAPSGEVFNVCSGSPRTVESLLHLLPEIERGQLRLQVDRRFVRHDEPPASCGSYDKARAMVGFEPCVDLRTAVRAAWTHEMSKCAA